MKYIALLRGINVGGKTLIAMASLKTCVEDCGFLKVRTYINSGNIIFETDKADTLLLAKTIEQAIIQTFSHSVSVVVINETRYRDMMQQVPEGWGEKPDWKYNMLFLIPPYDVNAIVADIGELKPEIEYMKVGDGIIYQSLLFTAFGKTTTGKLASRLSYKKMTIRNWNTARRLLALIDEA
jgi:uncharacterized protein (DUF1697 family)